MIEFLKPIKHKKIELKEIYELYISFEFEKNHVGFALHLQEKEAITLLNQYESKKLGLSTLIRLPYFDSFIQNYGSDFLIKNVSIDCYYDEYGRRCDVLVNKKFDIEKYCSIYSSDNRPIYYDFNNFNVDFQYSKNNLKETVDKIYFSLNRDDFEIDSFFYHNKFEELDFYVDKNTLDLVCITDPSLTKNIKIKNING